CVFSQSLPHGKQSELDTIADKKLVEDSCHVVLYRERADAQLFRDFLVAQSMHHGLHDFHFPCVASEMNEGIRPRAIASRHQLNKVVNHFTLHPNLSANACPEPLK